MDAPRTAQNPIRPASILPCFRFTTIFTSFPVGFWRLRAKPCCEICAPRQRSRRGLGALKELEIPVAYLRPGKALDMTVQEAIDASLLMSSRRNKGRVRIELGAGSKLIVRVTRR